MSGAVSPDNTSKFHPSKLICAGSKFATTNSQSNTSTNTRNTCSFTMWSAGMWISISPNVLVRMAHTMVTKGTIRTMIIFGGNELKSLSIPDRERPLTNSAQLKSASINPVSILLFLFVAKSVLWTALRIIRYKMNREMNVSRVKPVWMKAKRLVSINV